MICLENSIILITLLIILAHELDFNSLQTVKIRNTNLIKSNFEIKLIKQQKNHYKPINKYIYLWEKFYSI